MAESFPVGFGLINIKPRPHPKLHTEGGVLITGRKGERHWAGSLRTEVLTPGEYADLYGALTDAEERNLRFDLLLPRFRCPRAYTPGSWPLVAVPTIEAVTNLLTLSIAGLEVGMTLRRGDRFTIHKGELRCHRMVAAPVTVASATAQAVPIAFRLPLGVFAPGDQVHFIDPVLRVAVTDSDLPEEYLPSKVTINVAESLA